jgi:hypothetical protein
MIAYVAPQRLNEVEPPIDTLVNVGGGGAGRSRRRVHCKIGMRMRMRASNVRIVNEEM